MAKTKIDVSKHVLVPKHSKVSEKEKKELLEKYNMTTVELPKIFKNDPALSNLDATVGDIIKIARKSPTAGDVLFYRVVTDE